MPTKVFREQDNGHLLQDTYKVPQIMTHSQHHRVCCHLKSSPVVSLTPFIRQVADSTISSSSNAFCSEALSSRYTANEKCVTCSDTLLMLYKGIVVATISASSWSIVGAEWKPQPRIKCWGHGSLLR